MQRSRTTGQLLAVALGGVSALLASFGSRSAHADEPAPVGTAPFEAAPVEVTPPESVVVRGHKGDALKAASGSGTVITEEEISRAQPESLGELLARVPGLQIRQEDPTGFRL